MRPPQLPPPEPIYIRPKPVPQAVAIAVGVNFLVACLLGIALYYPSFALVLGSRWRQMSGEEIQRAMYGSQLYRLAYWATYLIAGFTSGWTAERLSLGRWPIASASTAAFVATCSILASLSVMSTMEQERSLGAWSAILVLQVAVAVGAGRWAAARKGAGSST